MPPLPNFEDPMDKKFQFRKYLFALKHSIVSKPPIKVDSAKLTAFMNWVDKMEIEHSACEYGHYFFTKEGFQYPGIIATRDIGKFEAFITVKSDYLISTQRAYNSELKDMFNSNPTIFSKDNKDIAEDMILIAYLLYEYGKKEKSFWYPMLQMWPPEAGLVFTWTTDELRELQDNHEMWEALNDAFTIDQYYDEFYKVASKYPQFFPKEVLTKQMNYYMWDMLSSRIFCSHSSTSMFSPFAETVNHDNVDSHYTTEDDITQYSSGPSSEEDNSINVYKDFIKSTHAGKIKYDEPDKPYYIANFDYSEGKNTKLDKILSEEKPHVHKLFTKNQTFKKGEQIFMSYGKCPNMKLLRNYGFCMEYNKYEFAEVSLVELASSIEKMKLALKVFHMDSKSKMIAMYYNIRVYYQRICMNLLTYCRIILFDEKTVNQSKSKLDLQTEMKTISYAIKVLQLRLLEFPTTLKEDLEILNGKTKSSRHYFAVLYRSEKKKILHHQIYLLLIAREIVERCINGAQWNDAILPTQSEKSANQFNIALNRKMLKSYLNMIKH